MNATIHLLSCLLLGTMIVHAQAEPVPIKVGDSIPEVKLRTEEDKEVSLKTLVSEKTTVLVFYRGSWCPYCNTQLQGLAGIEEDLKKSGAQILAISMDTPANLKATPDHDKLGYRLLSDSDATAIKAFGIAFKVDDATIERYKGYKIDLDAASGQHHHLLPRPSVFVMDTKGVIRFAHVNPDYRVRLEPAKVLEAARAVAK